MESDIFNILYIFSSINVLKEIEKVLRKYYIKTELIISFKLVKIKECHELI